MRKLRLLVPMSVIAVVVVLLAAPAAALAAPSQSGGGHPGWQDNWNNAWNKVPNKGWDNASNHGDHGNKGKPSYNACRDGFNYKVRWGDTLGSIAWRFGVNSWTLAQANGLRNPNRIYAGQTLWIPGNCRW
jgi:hypothetical protein